MKVTSSSRALHWRAATALTAAAVCAAAAFTAPPARAQSAWEPTKTVEFIVPAGTGGGADQMARLVQSIIASAAAAAQDSRDSERPRVERRGLVLALIVMSPVGWQSVQEGTPKLSSRC